MRDTFALLVVVIASNIRQCGQSRCDSCRKTAKLGSPMFGHQCGKLVDINLPTTLLTMHHYGISVFGVDPILQPDMNTLNAHVHQACHTASTSDINVQVLVDRLNQ